MTKEQSTTLTFKVGEAEQGQNPMSVRCADCAHIWVGLYLPQPISIAAKLMKNLTCPKCGAGSKRIRMHQ
jgi:Zn finger protein HypA/HybF involved in hydrogenase expression